MMIFIRDEYHADRLISANNSVEFLIPNDNAVAEKTPKLICGDRTVAPCTSNRHRGEKESNNYARHLHTYRLLKRVVAYKQVMV